MRGGHLYPLLNHGSSIEIFEKCKPHHTVLMDIGGDLDEINELEIPLIARIYRSARTCR